MSCSLTLSGSIVVGGSGCGCCSGSDGAKKMEPLGFACPGRTFGNIASTDCPQPVNSPNAFVPLPVGVGATELLMVKTSAPMVLRWGGIVPSLLGLALGTTVSFTSGDTVEFAINGVPFDVEFDTEVLTLEQVVARLNGAAVSSGAADELPFSLVAGQQIKLTGLGPGVDQTVAVLTALAKVGFASIIESIGTNPNEIPVNGIFLVQLDPLARLSGFEIKGTGNVSVLAAGNG